MRFRVRVWVRVRVKARVAVGIRVRASVRVSRGAEGLHAHGLWLGVKI